MINSGVRTHAAQRANSSGPRCIPTAARTLRKHTHFLYTPILVIVFYVCGLVQGASSLFFLLSLSILPLLSALSISSPPSPRLPSPSPSHLPQGGAPGMQ